MGSSPGPHDRLSTLRAAAADLRRYASTIPRERFERDGDSARQVKNALYEAADSVVALGQHVVAVRGLGPPSDYKAVFDLLARSGAMPAALAESMKDWAGFRNVLAHLYTALDLDRLDERRRTRLDDLDAFTAWAASTLDADGE